MKPLTPNVTHGGSGSTYTVYGCRCELCTEAIRKVRARRQAERAAEPKDPNDPRHGTYSFYVNHACRCEPCKAAGKEHNARARQRRKEAK